MTKIAVIGGGPGGYVAAIRAAQLGGEVTLVEKDHLGGTCLNVGCIPTKALLHSAEIFQSAKTAEAFGISMTTAFDFAKVQEYKAGVVKQLVSGVTGLLRANGVTVINGAASFASPHALNIALQDGGEQVLSFDKAIIATGSNNFTPPLPGIDSPQCIDSTGALALESAPKSLLIIGGGVIGVEMATAYAAFGTQITIIEMMGEILPLLDREMAQLVRKDLEAKGILIHTGAKVLSVEDNQKSAAVSVELNGETQIFDVEKVLVSVGRRANTAELNLDAAGIATDRGRIVVDATQQTNLKDVFAIGDCSSAVLLAHVASDQGEIAAENALGHAAAYNDKVIPSCVYTDPELGSVGLTEEQVKEQGIKYKVGRFPLTANGKTLISGGHGLVKIIVDEQYEEILGVHIVGPRATDLITEGALAIKLESTLDELIATIHAHPSIGEAVREAALAAQGRAIHIPNR
jgi:dihydrolipoamide dehydrogenase